MDCQLGGLDPSIAVRTTQCIWQTRGPNQLNDPFRLGFRIALVTVIGSGTDPRLKTYSV